jgi:peroxiredoxin
VSLDNDRRENQPAQDEPPRALQPGTLAPDFTLQSTPDHSVSLRDFRGHPVILAFYPADWSPVCGDQMALYNEVLPEFGRFQAQLLGISVDGVWCHAAFARDRKLHFPLLADFEPKGAVAKRFGVYRRPDGTALPQLTSASVFATDMAYCCFKRGEKTGLALLNLPTLLWVWNLKWLKRQKLIEAMRRAMASFIFFTVLHVVLVGILWMRLTAAQSSITGAALVPLVGHAAPDFTLRT